jgi:AcrR family transcriptional regulator
MRSKRMSSAERETQIVEEAIRFFSEVGFSGKTRELSRRLGISQPLLYRYFSSKQALIDRVYDHVFLGRWDPAWVSLIRDASRPLRDRLVEFYRQYAVAVYRPDWVRIYILAGLADTGLNKRYLEFVSRELLNSICLELRLHCGEDKRTFDVTPEEMEFVWSLHGGMFYYAVRHFIFGVKVDVDFLENTALMVDNFLLGVKNTLPTLLDNAAGARR